MAHYNDDIGPGYYGCAGELDDGDKRLKRFRKQRDTRGWDDTEAWNLDKGIACFILPRLRRLKKANHGHPGGLTNEEWLTIQDEMIEGLKAKVGEFHLNAADTKKWDRAKELLFLWFDHLWD